MINIYYTQCGQYTRSPNHRHTPSGRCYQSEVYTVVPTSEDVKEMKKAFRKKDSNFYVRWSEVYESEYEMYDLPFEYIFTSRVKASKFVGDLLMGFTNHSDLDLDLYGNRTLLEYCEEFDFDPKDFKLKEVNNLRFVIYKNEDD